MIWMARDHRIKDLQLDELLETFREDLPVYGEFLRYFAIKLGDLPYEFSTTLFKVGPFYNELKNIVRGMFGAYIRLVLLKSGYLPCWMLPDQEENIQKYYQEAAKSYENYYINSLLTGDAAPEGVDLDDYVNVQNPKECVRIFELSEFPTTLGGKIITRETFSDDEIDGLIKTINERVSYGRCEKLSVFIVVDPLLYRLAKEAVKDLKEKIKTKTGHNIVYSASELVNTLAIDRQLFEEEWQQKREEIISKLKEKYPFLSLHDEIWRIKIAQSEIKEALAELSKTGLREKECREIIWRISNAVEAYLGIIYHRWKNKSSAEKNFGQLLNELRKEIEVEFGEDVYNDLNFINEKRKIVDHPKPIKITIDDAVKVARKAELFQDLLLLKLSLKGD